MEVCEPPVIGGLWRRRGVNCAITEESNSFARHSEIWASVLSHLYALSPTNNGTFAMENTRLHWRKFESCLPNGYLCERLPFRKPGDSRDFTGFYSAPKRPTPICLGPLIVFTSLLQVVMFTLNESLPPVSCKQLLLTPEPPNSQKSPLRLR
ncbi:hypothetical protein AAG570_006618 [Ranatra chinensis]|uniref:Uncharacterized protein n=1 Tax=Ranatra chinensis TaxID=642074 RepID=A0ABD0YUI6_9HEMI